MPLRGPEMRCVLNRSLGNGFLWALLLWMSACSCGILITSHFPKDSIPTTSPLLPLIIAPSFLAILKVNSLVVLLAALGLFTFGITTFMTVAGSGFVFGAVAGAAWQGGLEPLQIFWASAPHSMELGGLWLAAGIGFLGPRFTGTFLGGGAFFQPGALRVLPVAFGLAMGLTVLAAFIEAEVTIGIIVEELCRTPSPF